MELSGLDLFRLYALIEDRIPDNDNNEVSALDVRDVSKQITNAVFYYGKTRVNGFKVNDPPTTPLDGDTYIVGEAPTGAWSGHTDELAIWATSQWNFLEPTDKLQIITRTTPEVRYIYRGSYPSGDWGVVGGSDGDPKFIYLTVDEVEALDSQNPFAFCVETGRLYGYSEEGDRFPVDGDRVLNTAAGGDTRFVDLTYYEIFTFNTSNVNMPALATTSDGDQGVTASISQNPVSRVKVFVNGLGVSNGPGGESYFMDPNTLEVKVPGSEKIGDTWHWNGSVAKYELKAGDRVQFLYMISSENSPSEEPVVVPTDASDVTYNNEESGLTAEEVQAAVDELAARKVSYPDLDTDLAGTIPVPASEIDWNLGIHFDDITLTADTVITFTNLILYKNVSGIITGDFLYELPDYCILIGGAYDPNKRNLFRFYCTNNTTGSEEVFYSISNDIRT